MRRKRSAIKQALTKLYLLLEQYAPSWYTQEHREMAERALARSRGYPYAAKTGDGIYELGDLRVDVRRIEVTLAGLPVPLAPREFQLLRYLVERPGMAISRSELLQAVWGYAAQTSTRTVDAHIASLRRKLEQDHSLSEMIITIKGTGYRFERRR